MNNPPFEDTQPQPLAQVSHGQLGVDDQLSPLDAFKDVGTDWGLLLARKVGELLMAGLFFPFLPLWMPLTWLILVWISGGLHTWGFSKTGGLKLSARHQIWLGRSLYWFNMACHGSAAFFLYVPDNPGMIGVLNVCLVCVGALCILQHAGDNWLGAVGTALTIFPMATRFLLEGGWVNTLQGIGGYMITILLAMYGRKQQAAFIEQAVMRKRAEEATHVVAALGLAKARFFASVSHDLRQPVHAIGLYLAPLLESATDERAKKAANGIYQSWHALDDLLSHVLDLTRMDAGTLQAELASVELAPLVTGLVVQHSAAAEKKSIRIVALVEPSRYILADMQMLKRVLSNLLDNAIKFTPEDGRIVIALRPADAYWCVQVRDNGRGIAQSAQSKVFEEFVQLDNLERDRAQGLGLGLAIAQRFTALMQGQLRLRSAPGAGTCMSVVLPKTKAPGITAISSAPLTPLLLTTFAPHTALLVPPSVRAAIRASGKSILVVEDDVLVAQAILQLLGDLNLPMLHATSAFVATKLASQACMAACDVRLPGVTSGLDLAVHLQAMQVPALLMTGESSANIKEGAHAHGLMLLIKPVKPQDFLDGLGILAERVLAQKTRHAVQDLTH
jgi:two-component system, sensor histidine kinase